MKFAIRSLLKSPGFTLVALITLALGIGVNTSMFSLIDELLFRAAPFPQGARIHEVIAQTRQGPRYAYAAAELDELRAKATAFSSITSYRYLNSALMEPGRPAEQVPAVMASADFFTTFGVQPFLGRAFTAEEALPGHGHVIVLSYAFWQKHFAGDPGVIGRALRADGESVTIIGVMPASFDWRIMWGTTAFWRPLEFTPDQLKSREYRTFLLTGRLRDGVTAKQAAAELAPVAATELKEFPKDYDGLDYRAVPLNEAEMDDDSRHILGMLVALSGFVLLIACANLANLQLARATQSMRDLAIRAALGASRRQLIRHQFTESLVLALAGGVLGTVIALWINRILAGMISIANEPGGLSLPINGPILVATFAIAALAGIGFGLVPALLSSRTDVVTSLKSQSRGSTGGKGHHRMRQVLIVAEVTLALVLLGGAGVMQRGFARFLHKDIGWDKDRVLMGALPLPEARFPTPESRLEFFRKIETRLAALPGVEKVALTTGMPVWEYGNTRKIHTEKQAGVDPANLPLASHVMVTSDFFATLGIPFVEGHGFAPGLKPSDPRVIVINEALAHQFWPGESALGHRLASINGAETVWSEVVGVVRNTEAAAELGNERVPSQVFLPVAHEPWTWIRLAVRSASPAALTDSVRRAVAEVDPELPVDDLITVNAAAARSNRNLVVVARLLDGFALLGLALAAVGLYGVISNLVAQRTTEFGIRLALGARPLDVLNLVLRHGLMLTGIGLVTGLAGAYGISRLLNWIMPRLVVPDAPALAAMTVILFAVAALACWLPARRATKVDPIVALKNE